MRLSGKNVHINLGDIKIQAQTASLEITDNSAVSQTRGVPDGRVDGDVAAKGELELTTAQFNLLVDAARNAGSWRGLDEFDMQFYAKTNQEELKVEAFGCALKVASLLDIDSKGGSNLVHKVPYDVTSPDFVRINGVPYLRPDETEDLLA